MRVASQLAAELEHTTRLTDVLPLDRLLTVADDLEQVPGRLDIGTVWEGREFGLLLGRAFSSLVEHVMAEAEDDAAALGDDSPVLALILLPDPLVHAVDVPCLVVCVMRKAKDQSCFNRLEIQTTDLPA